jgi:glycosyltransferase involved in cell wall biosynthesis
VATGVKVSIVMPVRNAAATLAECLESIREQTEPDYELLIVDDGSTDHSAQIVELHARADSRIRLLTPGRIGLVAALNHGISESRAPLIARMDADDVMLADRLEHQIGFMEEHPDIAVAGSLVELFSSEAILAGYVEYVRWQNECVTSDDIAANIFVESPLPHPSVIMRRESLESAGGYRAGDFPEDYELWLRMHELGMKFGKVPRVLLRWREQAERASRTDPRYERTAFDRIRAEYLARDPRITKAAEIVIWGSGRRTRQRAKFLIDRGVIPSSYIDIDPQKIGYTIDGIRVEPPESLKRSPRPFVLVYVTSHGAREVITSRLRGFGYAPAVDFLAVG